MNEDKRHFSVIRKYLTRNRIRHEIFAKVAYSAPVDIITSRSDFDIVVLIGGTALVFECKTGRIELANAAEITGKAAYPAPCKGGGVFAWQLS